MKNYMIKSLGVLLLAIALAACGSSPTPTAPPVDLPAPVVTAAVPTAQPNLCNNIYYPVKNKAVYKYTSTGSSAGAYSFQNVISRSTRKGFTVTSRFKKAVNRLRWECKPEGLAAMGIGLTDMASSMALRQFTNFTASNVTGVSLPANLAPGMEWAYAFDLQGTERVKPGEPAGNIAGRISMNYKAGNIGNVTVPAGSFDALAIEVKTSTEFQIVRANGQNQQIVSFATYTIWYAPGVGWIKSNGSGNLNSQKYFETIVLDSYTIP